jgi:hypothetical protein
MLKSGETRRISERYGVPFFPPLNNAEQGTVNSKQ